MHLMFSNTNSFLMEIIENDSIKIYDFWIEEKDINTNYFLDMVKEVLNNKSENKILIIPEGTSKLLRNHNLSLLGKRIKFKLFFEQFNPYKAEYKILTKGINQCSTLELAEILFQSDAYCESIEQANKFLNDIFSNKYGEVLTSSSTIYFKDMLIGFSIFTLYNGHPFLASYCIKNEFQGKGVAKVVLTNSIEKLFTLGYKELIATTDLENTPSISALNKLGFINYSNCLYEVVGGE